MANFNDILDEACRLKKEETISLLCKMIEETKIDPKIALEEINCKLVDENLQTVFSALEVLDKVFFKVDSIIHSEVCTPVFMEKLKTVYDSAKNEKLKIKIIQLLESWSDKFKVLPNYNNPVQNLLKYTKKEIKSGQESMSSEQDKPVNPSLPDWKEIRKKQHKQYLKSVGEPTSSDEEFINDHLSETAETTHKDESHLLDGQSVTNLREIVSKLPIEMQKTKQSRLHVQSSLEDIINSKKTQYYQQNNKVEFKQCSGRNCEDCAEHKNKSEIQENVILPKRLPKEMQKIKDSRALLKDSYEKYKESNKEAKKKPVPGTAFQNNYKYDYFRQKNKGKKEEDEQLKKALKLSVLEKKENNLLNFYDSEEDEDESDDHDLQRAINLSLAEQDKDFSF